MFAIFKDQALLQCSNQRVMGKMTVVTVGSVLHVQQKHEFATVFTSQVELFGGYPCLYFVLYN